MRSSSTSANETEVKENRAITVEKLKKLLGEVEVSLQTKSKEIIKKAELEAEQIKKEAKEEAKKIVMEAEKNAQETKKAVIEEGKNAHKAEKKIPKKKSSGPDYTTIAISSLLTAGVTTLFSFFLRPSESSPSSAHPQIRKS